MDFLYGRLLSSVVACLILSGIFTTPVFAQDLDNVTISGKIIDSNNAPVVGATLTATQIETGFERTIVANEDGRYKIIELPPGTYKVKASANGFGAKEKVNLITVSGQSVQLDFLLAPADVVAEQIVTIEEDANAVDITRTVVGGTVTTREIEELPNNSRNPLDLVLTLGGTSEEALSTRNLADDRNVTNRPLLPNRVIFRFPAVFPIQIILRLTVWTTMTTARQMSDSSRQSNQSPKFRLSPTSFPPNTVGLPAGASICERKAVQTVCADGHLCFSVTTV